MDKEKKPLGVLEFVVEIERLPYTDKKSWFDALKGFQSMHNLSGGQTTFEVFADMDVRRNILAKTAERMMSVSLDNAIPGSRIVEFDFDEEGDLYYAKIRVPDNPDARVRINMGKGKFVPRLLAHTVKVMEDDESKNVAMVEVMLCMDFVWKKGENTDEVSGGSKDSCDGLGYETDEASGSMGSDE